jgi:hypothetical protein
MTQPLEPGYVRVEDIPDWAREAWRLLWRRPLAFFAVSAVYHGVALSGSSIPVLSLVLPVLVCQACLLLLIRFVRATDHSTRVEAAELYQTLRRAILFMLVFTLICLAIFIVALLAATALAPEVPAGDSVASEGLPLFRWLWPGTLALLILYTGTIMTFTWFLMPLIALHEMTIGDARALARLAVRRNEKVILIASVVPFLVLILLGLLTEASTLLSPVVVPLFAAFQYVSYRHVFLGRKQNAPVPVNAARSHLADSANGL